MANTKVTGDLIASSTIATGNIADNAVTSDKISGITTAHITEGSNLYYTDARADARAALIVDSAPATLDTLNELAAALGDDPNFATTTANSIGLKAPLASPTFTGIITASSSSSGDYVRLYGSSGTGKWDIYGNGANLRISDNESAGILVVDTGATFGGNVMPAAENAHNIGSAAVRWEDLYVDDGFIRNAYIDTKIIHNDDTDNFIEFGTDTITISKPATFGGTISGSGIELSNYMQIKVDDAEIYWTNTANNDYWRWKRDASNNFICDHYNGSSTTAALSFSSSQNATFAGKASFNTTQAPTAKIQAGAKTFGGGNGVFADTRLGIMNNGSLTSIVNASTYNDANYPDYGLVFIQGPSTSSYNVWSISPDGPAKGSDLNFIYQAQATNIHTQTPMLKLHGSTGNATFAGNVTLNSGKYLGVGNTTPGGTRSKLGVSFNVTGSAASLAESVTYATMELYPYRNGSTYGMFFGNKGLTDGYIQSANNAGNASGHIFLNPFGGNIGIGTVNSVPSAKLQVQQDQTAESNVIFMNNSTGANAAIRLSLNVGNPAGNDPKISFNVGDGGFDWTMGVDNSDSDKFKISGGIDSHNCNLGTNDKLVIDGNGKATFRSTYIVAGLYGGEVTLGGSSTTFGLQLKYNQDAATTSTIYHSPGYSSTGNLLKLGSGSGNSNQLVLKGDGNVGIGTTSPTGDLDVAGPYAFFGTEQANNGSTYLTLRNYDSTLVDSGSIQNIIRMTGRYWSGATSQLVETRILSIHQESNGNGGSALGFSTQTGGSAPVEHMRIDKVGNVGIGTQTPARKLDVAGEITHEGLVPKAGAFVDGKVTINKTVSTTANVWTSLDISLSNIGGTGTFAVQVYSDAHGSTNGGWYSMYWSGIMSWYHNNANATDIDEVPLHAAGHAMNGNTLEIRTKLHTNDGTSYANRCELQIKTANTLSSAPISFRFRKLL